MGKMKVWLLLSLLTLTTLGYAAAKSWQYSREWEEFQAVWQELEAGLTGNYSFKWRPGLFSAVGEMHLAGCEFTDDSLSILKGTTTLVRLDLSNTKVTDVGLDHLVTVESLRELNLRDTQVTEAGVQQLQRALPNCTITR